MYSEFLILNIWSKLIAGLRQIFVVNRVKTPARQGKYVKRVKIPQTHTHQCFNCFRGKNHTNKGFQPFFSIFFGLSPDRKFLTYLDTYLCMVWLENFVFLLIFFISKSFQTFLFYVNLDIYLHPY